MAEAGEKGSMKARGSDDPKDDKENDEDKDSQGKPEDQVEKKDSPTVAALKEDQEEGVDDPQSEKGDPFHSEGVEQQNFSNAHMAQDQVDIEPSNDPTAIPRPGGRGQLVWSNGQQRRKWQHQQQRCQRELQVME